MRKSTDVARLERSMLNFIDLCQIPRGSLCSVYCELLWVILVLRQHWTLTTKTGFLYSVWAIAMLAIPVQHFTYKMLCLSLRQLTFDLDYQSFQHIIWISTYQICHSLSFLDMMFTSSGPTHKHTQVCFTFKGPHCFFPIVRTHILTILLNNWILLRTSFK